MLIFRGQINDYLGASLGTLVVGIFIVRFGYAIAARGLIGSRQVHLKNGIDTVERVLRVVVQAGLVFVGLQVAGLYLGYFVSSLLGAVVAVANLLQTTNLSVALPNRRHFRRIYDFAKFNVLTKVRSQTFSWLDIFILGFFVTSDLVGIYQVSWSIVLTFWLLPNAIIENLFPELSNLDQQDSVERIRDLLSESLIYTGIIPIGGLVGTILIGDAVLGIYGPEFRQGGEVLAVLAVLAVFKGYEGQIRTALGALDHPDLTFKINFVFILLNGGLNLVLVPRYDILGAGVATAVSVFVALVYAWFLLQSIVTIPFPTGEVGRQVLSALGMGALVFAVDSVYTLRAAPIVIAVAVSGAAVYFALIVTLSGTVRSKTWQLLDAAV
jgi:O-antigen/teichoic acid export membrane protein